VLHDPVPDLALRVQRVYAWVVTAGAYTPVWSAEAEDPTTAATTWRRLERWYGEDS
jgi:hypothetical protein